MLDKAVRKAIESFIVDTDALYETKEIFGGTLTEPPEYIDSCKICGVEEREHSPSCLFYSLFMAM